MIYPIEKDMIYEYGAAVSDNLGEPPIPVSLSEPTRYLNRPVLLRNGRHGTVVLFLADPLGDMIGVMLPDIIGVSWLDIRRLKDVGGGVLREV